MSATHAGPAVARRRRRRWALGTAIVLAVTTTAGVAAFTRLAPTQAVPANRATAAPATARVVRTDLVDRIKVRGSDAGGRPQVGHAHLAAGTGNGGQPR